MARMKFLCDAERCIECNACVTACKNEHEVPWGVNRRRVVTIQDGKPGERSISVACMHCSDAQKQQLKPPVKRSRKSLSTVLRTLTLPLTTQLSRLLIVRVIHCHGLPLVVQVSVVLVKVHLSQLRLLQSVLARQLKNMD
jgi:ferredoxin